jgi:hypothetical protein
MSNETKIPASTVAPSPVGEGQPVAWTHADDLRALHYHGRVYMYREEPRDGIALYLAAQAPKPASGGGEPWTQSQFRRALRNSYPLLTDIHEDIVEGVASVFARNLAGAIAAEADTAMDEADDAAIETRCASCWSGNVHAVNYSCKSCGGTGYTSRTKNTPLPLFAPTVPNQLHPPAADRLAQTVTDAIGQIRLIANNVISGHTFPVNNALRLIIEHADEAEAALRAREYAPAQK